MDNTLLSRPAMDWEQVRLNGGPPCFFVGEDGDPPNRFCGRAERWTGHERLHDYISLERFVAEVADPYRDALRALVEALKQSVVAVDDWLHVFAWQECSEEAVAETRQRIDEHGGTVAYIADVQKQNREAIAAAEKLLADAKPECEHDWQTFGPSEVIQGTVTTCIKCGLLADTTRVA